MRIADTLHRSLAWLALAACAAAPAWGQASWPTKPVTIVVGFAAGGPTDLVARVVAKALGEQVGQPVLVDNRPGAGATVAAASVARSPADGHTMLLVVPGLTGAETMFKSRRYDLQNDFAPISLIGTSSNWLLTPSNGPFRSLQDMFAQAAANPGRYSYAHGGTGGLSHLTAELMKSMKNLDIVQVPYRGNGPAMVDLVAGRTQLMFDQPISSESFVKSGQLRPLAVTSPTRLPNYPDVPTMQEAGLANFVIEVWYGLAYPAHTPEPVIRATQAALQKVLSQPDVRSALANSGVVPRTTTSQEMANLIRSEITRWRGVIEKNGITAQ